MTTTSPVVYQMHAAYTRALDFRILLTLDRQRDLETLIARGVTLDDFKLVLQWLSLKIAKGERNIGALRWSNLCADAGRFEEELSMARAEMRNRRPKPDAKATVIQQTRPIVVEQVPDGQSARPIKFWLEQMRIAAR